MNVGKRIQLRREELGLSVDEMADALGKDRSTIYRYERGDIEKLPTTVLEPLSKILKTTPAYLMGWAEEKSEKSSIYDKYNLLNYIGKKKADSYIDDLCEQEKYTKNIITDNIISNYNTPPSEIAAWGSKGTKGTYKKSKREIT